MAYTTIKKPSDYFNTKLYTGNGSAGHSITGVGHQPDLVWIKQRDSRDHFLFNSISGTTKYLASNLTQTEQTDANTLTAFGADGFTLGSGVGCNENNDAHVAWNWLANGAGSSNTDGSITSTVSSNTTSGFSIVSYTGNGTSGATIGHGLGVAPSMIIEKGRSVTDDWLIYHKSIGATKGLALNNTTAEAVSTGYWNDTAPTSSLFTIGNNGKVNTNGGTHIAYCFADVQGYSKFGSYTGNGNADGTFVYTGFKPAMVIIKRTNTAANWVIFDNKRGAYNSNSPELQPNTSAAEAAVTDRFDFVSNGIKFRSSSYPNGSGNSFIYMAFAEEPLVGDNPATAR